VLRLLSHSTTILFFYHIAANNERHRQEVASMQASASQVAGPSSSVPLLPPPQPVAITVGGPSRKSPPSPPPRPIPPPEEEKPLRSAIAQGKQPERRPRRISATGDKDGNAMKAGSVYTGTHHHRRRAASVLSRPSVRIEVHEWVHGSSSLSSTLLIPGHSYLVRPRDGQRGHRTKPIPSLLSHPVPRCYDKTCIFSLRKCRLWTAG
jgi:hypothetical protein